MNKSFVVASLASLLVTGNVLAADTGQTKSTANSPKTTTTANESPAIHRTFSRLDTNKDGYIESNEAKANGTLTHDFSRIAKNGKLSESEFAAWEMHHTSKSSTATKVKSETMPMQNKSSKPMGSPSTGGGYE